jgi:hypothetical protein
MFGVVSAEVPGWSRRAHVASMPLVEVRGGSGLVASTDPVDAIDATDRIREGVQRIADLPSSRVRSRFNPRGHVPVSTSDGDGGRSVDTDTDEVFGALDPGRAMTHRSRDTK